MQNANLVKILILEMRFCTIWLVAALSLAASLLPVRAEDGPGVRLRTVVIDPGHGGKDAGCISKDRKTYEKNLTLTMALQLGNRIKSEFPDVKVIYTRTTDKSVTLSDRTEIANRSKADLFISVHINSVASTSPSGSSAHVLGASSNKNRDLFSDNMELCRRENSVILLEDDYSARYQGFNPNDPESYIIFNLLQNAHLNNSLTFASLVQENMSKGPITRNRGISQDPFYVLYRTTMPSVLLELGFISNAADLAVLRSKKGQAAIVDRIFEAFRSYKTVYEESLGVDSGAAAPSVSAPKAKESAVQEKEQAGVQYGVQVFALSRKLSQGDPAFKGVSCRAFRSGNIYKYIGGLSQDRQDAEAFRKSIRSKFPDAYVVKVENGIVSIVK